MKHINEAVKVFFQDTLSMHPQQIKRCTKKAAYFSSIDISINEEKKHYIIGIDELLINSISDVLLFDDSPDTETKDDLIKEITNILIGRVKMEYEAENSTDIYKLTPPSYLKNFKPKKNTKHIKYSFEHGCCAIFQKEVT